MKILRRTIGISILLMLMTASAFADYTISWQEEGGTSIIPASSADVECGGQLEASKYLVNTGETISFKMTPGAAPKDFMGRSRNHHSSAKYKYQGICEYMLSIDGKDYLADSMDYSFAKPGDYEVRGFITYMWQTSKVGAGFPRYYYKKRIMIRTVRVSDLEDAVAPEQKDDPQGSDGKGEKEEVIKPTLSGSVFHTEDWEKNREQFNTYCRNSGNEQWLRDSDVFWSGEKFCLSAVATGKNQPAAVEVKIQGHPYETTLQRRGGSWEGVLFDKSMIDRWGRDGPETLTFVFSAVIDGSDCQDIQKVTVDDLQKYWLMHRKE